MSICPNCGENTTSLCFILGNVTETGKVIATCPKCCNHDHHTNISIEIGGDLINEHNTTSAA